MRRKGQVVAWLSDPATAPSRVKEAKASLFAILDNHPVQLTDLDFFVV